MLIRNVDLDLRLYCTTRASASVNQLFRTFPEAAKQQILNARRVVGRCLRKLTLGIRRQLKQLPTIRSLRLLLQRVETASPLGFLLPLKVGQVPIIRKASEQLFLTRQRSRFALSRERAYLGKSHFGQINEDIPR